MDAGNEMLETFEPIHTNRTLHQARPTTVRELRLGVALAYPKITLTVEPSARNTIPSPERRFSGYLPKCLLLDTETVHGLVHQALRNTLRHSPSFAIPCNTSPQVR
jgi:hypothetical protein